MRSHPDIDFVVDEVVPVGENPNVMNGEFDTRDITPGQYDFYLLSYADPDCYPSADTTIMTLDIMDNCTLNDTTLLQCPNYIVARYYPEILGGNLYDATFALISNLSGFFENIDEEDLPVSEDDFVYHIITNQFGVSDTSKISIEIEDTELEIEIQVDNLSCTEDIIISAIPNTALAYQWYKDSILIIGSDSSTLVINALDEDREGIYYVYVSTDTSNGYSNEISIEYPSISINDTLVLCHNDEYQFGDILIRTSGDYVQTFSQNGCDSIVELTVFFETLLSKNQSITICEGESYILYNDTVTTSGIYEDRVSSQSDGCDTLVSIDLEVLEAPKGDTIEVELVDGQVFEFLGRQYSQSGIYSY